VIAASRPEEGRDRIKRIEAVEECVEKQRRGFVEPSSRFANPPMRSAPSSPTSAGVVQPHSLMLAAIAATCASVWVRALFAYGISRAIDHRSTLSAGHGL